MLDGYIQETGTVDQNPEPVKIYTWEAYARNGVHITLHTPEDLSPREALKYLKDLVVGEWRLIKRGDA